MMMMLLLPLVTGVLLLSSFGQALESSNLGNLLDPDNQKIQLVEADRVQEYKNRNYTWPLNNYMPNTPGWKRLMEQRFAQVEELEHSGDRYEGYIQTIHSAFLVPNFTEHVSSNRTANLCSVMDLDGIQLTFLRQVWCTK